MSDFEIPFTRTDFMMQLCGETGKLREYFLRAAAGQMKGLHTITGTELKTPSEMLSYMSRPGTGDHHFFVMEFVPGDERGREDRSLEIALASDLLTALAQLHELATPEVLDSFDTVPSPGEATHVQIDRWAETYQHISGLAE